MSVCFCVVNVKSVCQTLTYRRQVRWRLLRLASEELLLRLHMTAATNLDFAMGLLQSEFD